MWFIEIHKGHGFPSSPQSPPLPIVTPGPVHSLLLLALPLWVFEFATPDREPPHSLSQLHGITFSGFIILWLTIALLGLFPTCSISFTHSLTQQLLTTHYIPGTRIQQWAEMDMVLVLMENKAEWGKQAFIFNSMPYPVSSHHVSHTHDLSRSTNLREHLWTPTFTQMC